MNVKNKIIKWLGGYTQNELIEQKKIVEQKKIEVCRTEKPILPIAVEFAATTLDHLDIIKNNLCYQVAEFMFKYNLLYYDVSRNETNDCYIVRAKAYVREP